MHEKMLKNMLMQAGNFSPYFFAMFICMQVYTLLPTLQGLFLKIFPFAIDTFSTVIHRDVNGKNYLCLSF